MTDKTDYDPQEVLDLAVLKFTNEFWIAQGKPPGTIREVGVKIPQNGKKCGKPLVWVVKE